MATKKSSAPPSTQRYLDIASIRDGVVIMKDGTLRAVLMVSSVNFALKSEEEQSALVNGYVSFLNTLEYPIQVVIQSRKMNIDVYINQLKEQEQKQTNELLRGQIQDYRQFVVDLIELGEIMQKRFYVVVPYDPVANKKKGFFTRLKEAMAPARIIKLKEKQFKERTQDLQLRIDTISGALQGMSLKVVRLDTQGLIELFYNTYNPVTSQQEELTDVSKVQVEGDVAFAE
ncbi:MAG: TraC family protein [Patescibacteria group bacterium]